MRKFFLTLGYSGLSPKAPGTVGSIVALALGLLLLNYISIITLFLLAILISAFAVKQIDIYEKEVGAHDGSEIVIRRYLNNRSGKSKYQIVKYFLCSKCYEYRICKGMSAIDLTHKDFKELIDGYIKSI